MARMLDDRNLALWARTLRIAPHIEDVMLQADPEKLRVILDNQLSNAFKFSPPAAAQSESPRAPLVTILSWKSATVVPGSLLRSANGCSIPFIAAATRT